MKKNKKALPASEANSREDTASGERYWFRGDWRSPKWLEEKLGIANIKFKLDTGAILDEDGFRELADSGKFAYSFFDTDYLPHTTHCPYPVCSGYSKPSGLVNFIFDNIEAGYSMQKQYEANLQKMDIYQIDSNPLLACDRDEIARLTYVTRKHEALQYFFNKVHVPILLGTGLVKESQLPDIFAEQLPFMAEKVSLAIMKKYPNRRGVNSKHF